MVEQKRDPENWHTDRRLTVGHLLTTLTLAGALFVWFNARDARIEIALARFQIAEQVLTAHLGAGPHPEADIRLTVLETEFRSFQKDLRGELTQIRRLLENNRPPIGPGQ